MILVDTSVWVDHLRSGGTPLAGLLVEGRVCIHRMIIGELACGNLRDRETILRLLSQLPKVAEATHDEVMRFIEIHQLMGRGIGYIDMHLLTAASLDNGVRLWTRDKRLTGVTVDMGLGFPEPG